MTSTPMVETIARAICRSKCPGVEAPGQCAVCQYHEYFTGAARAALSALSTPNEGMVEAGTIWASDDPAHVREIFTAMIQSALNEGKA